MMKQRFAAHAILASIVSVAAGAGALDGCSSNRSSTTPPTPVGPQGESDHSSSIAISADDSTIYVVNADSDSVSFIDAKGGTLTQEVLLGAAAPAADSAGHYTPSVSPRALALGPGGTTLYVTGEASGHIYALDTKSHAIVQQSDVCSEPVGVVASPDGKTVFVACSQDDAVVALDSASLKETSRTATNRRPWTLGWSADRTQIYATHLLGPGASGISVITPSPIGVASVWTIADGPPGSDPTVPHGEIRGIYDVLARPGSKEVWFAHMMLGTDTAQPTLSFLSTAFSAIGVADTTGTPLARLTVSTTAGDGAAFGDVVSGPRALAFSPDGSLLFMADTGSEDVLVVDTTTRLEVALVRPLPGHQPEGVAASHDGLHVYVDQRNSGDIAVLDVATSAAGPTVTAETTTIARFAQDPMPTDLRFGQHLFYSANSDELPLTTDHWISCATCHLEGRSDAVTWHFNQGPRDTPSNAGGVLQTGFLFRLAARNKVQDYWQTIDIEQGGHFGTTTPSDPPATGSVLANDLDSLANYVNYAIPYPSPPRGLDPTAMAQGQALFTSLGCGGTQCHSGPAFTDSGSGNPTLDLTKGTANLHDVGTCVTATGVYDDVALPDELGDPRDACKFDTPTLRGIADSAPYLHDGSAATLEDVVSTPNAHNGETTALSASDVAALVTYLRSL